MLELSLRIAFRRRWPLPLSISISKYSVDKNLGALEKEGGGKGGKGRQYIPNERSQELLAKPGCLIID